MKWGVILRVAHSSVGPHSSLTASTSQVVTAMLSVQCHDLSFACVHGVIAVLCVFVKLLSLSATSGM